MDERKPSTAEINGASDEGQPADLGCCCGPRRVPSEETGALWNDHTHYMIVETAIERIIHGLQGESPLVRSLYRLWRQEDRGFPWDGIVQHEMRRADYNLPWAREQIGDQFFYNDHFYDPATGRNYRGEATSAVTVGTATFDESVKAWGEGYFLSSAKSLGTSLHFLTDLIQPMHAANFTNANRPILAHHSFEEYAEKKVGQGYFAGYPIGTLRDLTIGHFTAKDFLLEVAGDSKRVFVARMKDFLDYNERTFNPRWPPEVADPCLAGSLWLAPRIVARYLLLWAMGIGLAGSLESGNES